jgi:hypothetical protein
MDFSVVVTKVSEGYSDADIQMEVLIFPRNMTEFIMIKSSVNRSCCQSSVEKEKDVSYIDSVET